MCEPEAFTQIRPRAAPPPDEQAGHPQSRFTSPDLALMIVTVAEHICGRMIAPLRRDRPNPEGAITCELDKLAAPIAALAL